MIIFPQTAWLHKGIITIKLKAAGRTLTKSYPKTF